MAAVAEESVLPFRKRPSMKYVITQNNAMNRYPPIRCSVSIRALALAAFNRDHDSSTSHTFSPPKRRNANPSIRLAEVVSMGLFAARSECRKKWSTHQLKTRSCEHLFPSASNCWAQRNGDHLIGFQNPALKLFARGPDGALHLFQTRCGWRRIIPCYVAMS